MIESSQPGSARTLLQLRVGAFILAALAVFAGLVFFLGRQAGLFERQYRLLAAFPQIGGLIEGATVRLAGVPVGRVTGIQLPGSGAARVRVELSLVRRVQDRIREDSVARIETLGLLGDKIIEISLGGAQARALPDGGEVRTEEPLDTTQLTVQGTVLLRNLVELSGELRATLARLTEAGSGPNVFDTARAAGRLVSELERGQGLLHALLYDARIAQDAAEAMAAFRRVGDTVGRLDRLLADPAVAGLGQEAGRTLAEARQTIERVNRIVREVEQGPGLLHTVIYGEGRVVRELDGVLVRVGALVAGVERGEGALGMLVRDADTARAVRQVARALEGLTQGAERARESDGLLQALLFEPEGRVVVGDLRETVRHLREVTGRVARGEGLLGGLTQPGTESAVRDLAEGLSALGRLGSDERLVAALGDLRAALGSLRAITARVEAGEGTVGGLLVDPTVYENLAAFLEGAQRSLLLRALIRAVSGTAGTSGPGGAGAAGRGTP